MYKKIILLVLTLLFVQPALAAALVSFSVSGTTIPTTIEPGSRINLILTLTNVGTTTAQNVKLTLKPNNYMTPDQYTYNLQTIQSGSSTQVIIPLKISGDVPEGANALFFLIEYAESDVSGTKTLENSVTIYVTKRSLIELVNVSYNKDLIEPGDTIAMEIELQNLGKGSVKDLVVSLKNVSSLFVPVGSDTDSYLGSLQPGAKSKASFNLIVNKNAETIAYSIPVVLTYYDEANVLHTDQKYIGIKISGKPEFVVTIEKTDRMYAGNLGKLSISISNRGTATAYFLTAKIDSSLSIMPKENYIGNLDPDDSSTISLDVNLKNVGVGKHSLNVILLYKDPYNKDYTEEKTLQFDVTSMPLEISTNMKIIIVLAIVGILYWKRNFIMSKIKRK